MEVLSSEAEELALLARFVRAVAAKRGHLEILEAGCGQHWPLQLADLSYRLTGIDLDAEALRLRQATHGDLDRAIVGDICTADLPAGAFDVIYSSFVLEHIADAPRAPGNPRAGTPGHGPHPTHYHPVMSRPGLRHFGARHGLPVLEERGVRSQFSGSDLRSVLARVAQRLVSVATFGRFAATHNNLVLVLTKAS